jgi:hypothetical protein
VTSDRTAEAGPARTASRIAVAVATRPPARGLRPEPRTAASAAPQVLREPEPASPVTKAALATRPGGSPAGRGASTYAPPDHEHQVIPSDELMMQAVRWRWGPRTACRTRCGAER